MMSSYESTISFQQLTKIGINSSIATINIYRLNYWISKSHIWIIETNIMLIIYALIATKVVDEAQQTLLQLLLG